MPELDSKILPHLRYAVAGRNGDTFHNTGREFFLVANRGGKSVRVTFAGRRRCDCVVTVPRKQSKIVGPFDPKRFNDQQGRVKVRYSHPPVRVVVAVIPWN